MHTTPTTRNPATFTARPCPTCLRSFQPTAPNHRFCLPAHRPSHKVHFQGQAGTYFIEGMTAAEFAFQVVMRRQGVRVKKIRPSGTRFALNGHHYRPDFYDPRTRTYYEVAGTRQAYHLSKPKIAAMKRYHPAVILKIVKPDGTEIHP